ncbi:MAG: flagellar FlbD family protein [Desulfobulbaceae bacterium]|nr:MAG: flagellar FlbD family protein [Desulfobulbaceae bacterium]
MIKLTKMNGHECLLNHTLIEIIEESPDTCITLSNGNRYIVLESGEVIREKIIEFSAEVMRRAGYQSLLPQDGK